MTLNFLGGTLGFVGFFILAGAMGSDCDGKCMENAMGMMDLLKYMTMGLLMMIAGIYLTMKGD